MENISKKTDGTCCFSKKKISHSDYVSIDSQQDLQLFIINHNEFITETKIANVSVMSW